MQYSRTRLPLCLLFRHRLPSECRDERSCTIHTGDVDRHGKRSRLRPWCLARVCSRRVWRPACSGRASAAPTEGSRSSTSTPADTC